MRVSSSSLSETAARLEHERERDFFRLLYIIDRARVFAAVPMNKVDWRLTCDCLDDMNHRFADTSFLVGFTGAYVVRNRTGRTLLSRFWLSIYVGLVMCDRELRRATRAPALQYWNSICTLDTEVGRIARVLHTPSRFYEAAPARESASAATGPSATPAHAPLSRYTPRIVSSLFLTTLCAHVFAGSSWRHRTSDDTEETALVLNNRFLRWRVFESRMVQKAERTDYSIHLSWLPSLVASDSLRRSFQCRDLILEESTLGGRLWYRTHFMLLRGLGLAAP